MFLALHFAFTVPRLQFTRQGTEVQKPNSWNCSSSAREDHSVKQIPKGYSAKRQNQLYLWNKQQLYLRSEHLLSEKSIHTCTPVLCSLTLMLTWQPREALRAVLSPYSSGCITGAVISRRLLPHKASPEHTAECSASSCHSSG